MVFNLLIPELNSKPQNTKDAVISILTSNWPLSLRQIFFALKKNYHYNSSYQAVFKAVNELLERKVLVRKGKEYEINIDWVKKLQSFTDIVETNYYAYGRMNRLSGIKDSKQAKDLLVMNFETVFDAEKYLYYLMKNELFKTKSDKICYHTNSEWRPIFYLRSEYNYYKRLMKRGHKFYFLCSSSSQMEKLCVKFYDILGVDYKFVKQKFASDVLVFGDYFIQIFIPADLKQETKKLLLKKDLMELLTSVLEKKSDIRVVITKDAALASEIKKQTLKEFGK